MNTIKFDFESNLNACIEEIERAAIKSLHEASGEVLSRIIDTTPVDTGQLKNSWEYKIDKADLKSTIGSPLENAIYNEMGTGEYALAGDGRKGGWVYEDAKGKHHFTLGKKPNRTLQKAFVAKRPIVIKIFQNNFNNIK